MNKVGSDVKPEGSKSGKSKSGQLQNKSKSGGNKREKVKNKNGILQLFQQGENQKPCSSL